MIKLKDILNEVLEGVPRVLYHATFKALIPSIKQKGIIMGGDKYRNFVDSEIGGVYLGYSADYANDMVEASENDNIPKEWFDEIVILTIDTSKLDLSKLDIDPNILPPDNEYDDIGPADGIIESFIYRDNIPFSAVININKYD